MKKILHTFAVALIIVTFYGCSKSSGTGGFTNEPLTAELWPQNWILTIDYDASFYKYLNVSGIVIYRNLVDKGYSMTALANEKDCKWEVKSEGMRNGKAVYSFHLARNKKVRWIVGKTGSVAGTPEWYLGVHTGDIPPPSDDWLFYIHSMEKQNGHKTVVIESASRPGWYLDDIGHTLTANGVRLVEYDRPEKAVRLERH